MVRKIKVTEVQEEAIAEEEQQEQQEPQEPQEEATPPATEPEPAATPEPHDNTTTTPTEAVALFEATIEPGAEAATNEAPTPKPKRPPRKKKEKETHEPKTTPPPIEESPPTPEVEHPAEEIKISPPKAKAKPRAKPKAKTKTTPTFPTHDDEGQRIRPPPSLERPTKPETAEEFWNNTLKNMKEQKDRQYASLIQAAF